MTAAGAGGTAGRGGPRAARLAWSLLGCSLLLTAAGVGVRLWGGGPVYPYFGELLVNGLVLATVGALVAARRPDHPIGWLFGGVGLAMAAQLLAGGYAMAALADLRVPAGAVAAVAAEELRIAGLGMLVAVMLLFPTGRPPSPRWWPLVWLGGVGLLAHMAREGLTPGRGEHLLGHENPFWLSGATALLESLGLLEPLFLLAVLAAIASLVVRFRRSRGVERQQLKWFVSAAVIALAVLVAANLLLPEVMGGPLGSILWGAVPASLALAVAASTLAVAALFGPARRRVQEAVDRRFNRARYDAARTVEGFSARLRDQVDLDTLSAELLAVVDRTVRPAVSSLWLRPVASRAPRPAVER